MKNRTIVRDIQLKPLFLGLLTGRECRFSVQRPEFVSNLRFSKAFVSFLLRRCVTARIRSVRRSRFLTDGSFFCAAAYAPSSFLFLLLQLLCESSCGKLLQRQLRVDAASSLKVALGLAHALAIVVLEVSEGVVEECHHDGDHHGVVHPSHPVTAFSAL